MLMTIKCVSTVLWKKGPLEELMTEKHGADYENKLFGIMLNNTS